jgi:hypothetical protein
LGGAPAKFGLAVAVDPITITQFFALAPSDELRNAIRSRFTTPPDDAWPITLVSRAQCDKWLTTLNARLRQELRPDWPLYRLLTDSEWTYACACGLDVPYVIGDRVIRKLDRGHAVFRYSEIDRGVRYVPADNPRSPAPVHDARNQTNSFGLRGMHGNIRELVTDAGLPALSRLMGGGFQSGPVMLDARYKGTTSGHPEADVGFRVARPLWPEEFAKT